MKTYTPIELLKNKLVELKLIPEVEPNIIIEYEKAVLVLELIGSTVLSEKVNDPNVMNNLDSNHKEPKKESKSYYERFIEAQKNRNNKSK
jgi:hypothetical protein